jgi:hypothetical protein
VSRASSFCNAPWTPTRKQRSGFRRSLETTSLPGLLSESWLRCADAHHEFVIIDGDRQSATYSDRPPAVEVRSLSAVHSALRYVVVKMVPAGADEACPRAGAGPCDIPGAAAAARVLIRQLAGVAALRLRPGRLDAHRTVTAVGRPSHRRSRVPGSAKGRLTALGSPELEPNTKYVRNVIGNLGGSLGLGLSLRYFRLVTSESGI